MMDERPAAAADRTARQRLATALRLHSEGVSLMRENLRRRYPNEDDESIERRLSVWLAERPGAEHGDAEGRRRIPTA